MHQVVSNIRRSGNSSGVVQGAKQPRQAVHVWANAWNMSPSHPSKGSNGVAVGEVNPFDHRTLDITRYDARMRGIVEYVQRIGWITSVPSGWTKDVSLISPPSAVRQIFVCMSRKQRVVAVARILPVAADDKRCGCFD
jgi:hypothetical protein